MSLGSREDELYSSFHAILGEELPHVCVGGIAVSAFLPRSTLDIDIVAPSSAHEEYRALFGDLGYEFSKEYESDGMYHGRMVQYQKAVGDYTVEVELLLDALQCRQTDADWGYDYMRQHSVEKTIRGTRADNELVTWVAEPELLVAVKLHSGRPQDARDTVAVAAETDLDRIATHLSRGDADALRESFDRVLAEIQREEFEDSFKGVFSLKTIPEERIDDVSTFLERYRDAL